jgi:excisionase family DNA binding protein
MTIRLAYRPEEVAQLLGLGRTTVFELLRSGELESVKAGRARLVPADAIDRYLSKASAGARTAS